MKKNFAVIGLGRFGLGVVEELSSIGADVIAIDFDEKAVEKASKFVSYAVVCDATNEDNLIELGIQNVSHAVVCIGSSVQNTILTTVILKELGVEKITVRLDNDYYAKTIIKLGATEIIYPEKSSGIRLARKIVSDSFVDFYNIDKDYVVVQIHVSEVFAPQTIQELDPRNKFEVNVVLIKRDGTPFIPKGVDQIMPNDEILTIGKNNSILKFDQFINKNG